MAAGYVKTRTPILLVILITACLYKFALHLMEQQYIVLSGFVYLVVTVFIQFACNTLLTYFVGDPYNYRIDLQSEFYRIKKTFGAAFYCAIVCLIQYKVSQGFSKFFWFPFYLYEGCLIFRVYSFLEKYIPGSLKPFPYFNIASSSNVVLWLVIAKEIGGLGITF
jgi:hypothetical protein